MEDILNAFNSDIDENEDDIEEVPDPLSLNPKNFEILKLINLFQSKGVLIKDIICPECNEQMKLEKNKQYLDNYCWRCRSKNPQHDIKYNIRKNSIFENIKIPLSLIYYLSFKCFIENMSTNKSLTNSEELCKKLHIPNTTHKSKIKLFRLLRNRIKISFHLQWNRTKLALDPAENGHPSVEID